MANLTLFFFGSYGLAAIIIDSDLFRPMREWFSTSRHQGNKLLGKILTCYQCCGFWSGFLLAPIVMPSDLPILDIVWYFLASSCSSSAVCPILAGLKEWLNIESLLKKMR